MLSIIYTILLCCLSQFPSNYPDTTQHPKIQNSELSKTKYDVGDRVKCSQWENSYWEGKVVRIVKDVIYQVQLEKIYVDGAFKLYLKASECTGMKTLSFENGKDYHETKIWVHADCLD